MALLLGSLPMALALPVVAHAAPPQLPRTATATPPSSASRPAPRRAHAWMSIHAGRTAPWVGQAIPVTVTAYFRGVEGVTLDGAPVLDASAIMTSDLAKDPQQSTEIVDGEPVVVARWAGTVTPSTAGALDLKVTLPVKIRFREAAPPRVDVPDLQDDPFSDPGNGDPFDAMFNRMRQRMLQTTQEAVGRVHEESTTLKAATPSLDVHALPTANRPATFSGAVGAFQIDATVSSAKAAVSDPLTLRIAVGGDVDLDRVDLPGVASSADWKAYPPRVVAGAAVPGKAPQKATPKVFEQVIVPLHGGELTVPPVSFTSFDPTSGTYLTHATQPLTVTVEGAAAPPDPAAPPAANPSGMATLDVTTALHPVPAEPAQPVPVVTPRHVAFGVLPVLALLLAALVARVVARKRGDWALRRSMRRAAVDGQVEPFLGSAHRLIEARLSKRWGVTPSDITPARVRERLGDPGGPLVDILTADAAIRFGRGDLEGAQLGALCKSVEQSLRSAS